MRGVAQHGGRAGQRLGHEVVADDDDSHAGRAHVLLNAAVDEAVLRHVHGLGQEARRHVGHQRFSVRVGQLVVHGAVDGLVLADVDVVGVVGQLEGAHVGHVAEVLVLGGGDAAGIAEDLRFLERLLRPRAADDVVGHLVLHEVHGDHRELRGRAAL